MTRILLACRPASATGILIAAPLMIKGCTWRPVSTSLDVDPRQEPCYGSANGSNTPGRQDVDWFEQIFHLDPDHGNGMFELAILVLLVLAISTIVYRFRGRAARKAAESDDRR